MTRARPTPARDFKLDFGPLARTRERLNVTQEELAEAAGIHRVTLSNTERNRTDPLARQIFALARALGVRVQDIVTVVDVK